MGQASSTPHFDKILVVDDTSAQLQLLTGLLTDHGYTVYPASDGELALEFVRSTLPDLILLDVQMPGTDGYEVCRRLKAEERTRAIPIIFVTILEDEHDKVRGFQMGAVDFVTKPFQPDEVLARIRMHLRVRELTERLEHTVAERTAELEAANERLRLELGERRRAEEALRQSEALLNATQRLAQVGGWEFEVATGKAFWTEELYRIHEMPGDPGTDRVEESLACYRPEDRPVLLAAFRDACEKGLPYDLELPFTALGGTSKWVRTTGHPVLEAGKPVRVIGNVIDITERKRAEEAVRRLNQELEERVRERTALLQAANKELEAFAYSVSHDLRAPLRHIAGFSELLQERVSGTLDELSRRYMSTISDSVQHMGKLIDDLLAFSRMGRCELSRQEVDLAALGREAVAELEPDAAGRSVEWRIADLPRVVADRTLLRSVLVNLLSNALKFTRSLDRAVIEIGAQQQEAETVVFVRDNGVGFDPAYAGKLFGVFQRLHRAEEFEGTGIGLANVRRVVERHGGRTWAEGRLGQGATFYFSLPRSRR